MEEFHKNILKNLEEKIIIDIDVNYGIMEYLKKDNILTDADANEIGSQKNKLAKAKLLLKILPDCGPNAFTSFYTSLKSGYWWLCDEIDNFIEAESKKLSNMTDPTRLCRSPVMPLPPPLMVHRHEKTEQLKSALNQLMPGGYVVLHGLKGFGRSCLAVKTLQDQTLVKKLFNSKIYWIKFGYNDPIDDEIWIQLNNLYYKVKNSDCPRSHLSLPEVRTRSQIKHMCRELRHHFVSCKLHSNSLLVLDDVWDKRMIETFDFECKTLVITTDLDLLNNCHKNGNIKTRQKTIIEMKDGFTEDESLKLFSEALDISISSLPFEAREIHKECCGMPIFIAMFAAEFQEFKDEMKIRSTRWQYYLNAIRQQDTTNRVIETSLAKQETIFDMCIDRLFKQELSRYLNLAIFSEDVNITRQTLAILWEVDEFKAEDLIVYFCKKSLAVKQWNDDLKIYIYGVHDLLLSHLKRKINKEGIYLADMHRRFVQKYFNYCGNDLSKLPTDNYSYSYIGYHLEQACMYEEFERVFLDLGFIQGKICNSGVNDLLLDLKKYRRHIVMNDNFHRDTENKVTDLENFLKNYVKTIVEYRGRECLDLIQMILNSGANQGYLYQKASELASSKAQCLYLVNLSKQQLSNLHRPSAIPDHYHEVLNTELCTLNFTDNPDKLIIGGKSGKLTWWDCSENKKHFSFYGFDKKSNIVKVIVAHKGSFFFVLNDKSVIKQFSLSRVEELDKSLEGASSTPSTPQEKQSFWSEMHRSDSEDNSMATYTVDRALTITDIALSSDDQRLAACTSNGVIKVWDVGMKKRIPVECKDVQNQKFQLVTFSNKCYHLHAVNTKGTITVFVWNRTNYVYKTEFNPLWKDHATGKDNKNRDENDNRKVIYFREIPENDENDEIYFIFITETKAITVFWNVFESGDLIRPEARTIAEVNNNNVKYLTATLTHDGQYIMIADSDDYIKIFKFNGGFHPVKTYRERVVALDTYWDTSIDHNNYCHLIISGNKYYIQRLIFGSSPQALPPSPPTINPLFDTVMKLANASDEKKDLDIVAQVINENRIRFFVGDELPVMTPPRDVKEKINNLILNSTGDKVLYTLDTGGIFTYDVPSGTVKSIVKLSPEYTNFVKLMEYESTKSMFVVCGGRDNLIIVSCDSAIPYNLSDTGHVIAFYNIDNKCAITVASDENIIIWKMNTSTSTSSHCEMPAWQRLWPVDNNINNNATTNNTTTFARTSNSNVCYSSLNAHNNMLAILKTNHDLNLYLIGYDKQTATPIEIAKYYETLTFPKTLTCCAFSPDSKYLAIGMFDGEIAILTTDKCAIDRQLIFHRSSILQLYWAPLDTGVPILLSVNCDELAWWKIDLVTIIKRRSRIGLTRSYTVPLTQSKALAATAAESNEKVLAKSPPALNSIGMRNSLTLNFESAASIAQEISSQLENLNDDSNDGNNSNNINERAFKYWSSKKSPYGNRWPALLELIRLPPHCRSAKVCVSSDFIKFLLVDVNGSIHTFKLFQF